MADPITWYALGRTVGDTESIMEEMDAKILTHNLDPSAHGQTGEVVFEHRNATLLDHLLGSVDLPHLVSEHFFAFSNMGDLSTWPGSGTIYSEPLSAYLETLLPGDPAVYRYLLGNLSGAKIDPTKNPFFQAAVKFVSITTQQAFIGCGAPPGEGYDDSFGFKVVNNTLYAYWTKTGTPYTSEITGITLTDLNIYRAFINSTDQEIYFYVNGVLKYTATTNFPDTINDYCFSFWIYTTGASNRRMYLINWAFQRDH